MLELQGLTRRYGDLVALDNLSFSVPPGQIFGFLGPNGAGKTTTLRTVLGLSQPDAGTVRWQGQLVGPEERLAFGYMPEERGLYPRMRVDEHLVYLGRLHGLSAADASSAANGWLDRLGLGERRHARVDTLSQGNQQRVQLAAAVVHEPELLVLDEPFSGLDPVAVDTLSEVLAEKAAAGAGVLFSSHQLDLVEDLCQSVAIIHRGRLVTAGTVDDLATRGFNRLAVEVGGDTTGAWARSLAGVRVLEGEGARLRLVLEDGIDPQLVLDAARRAGPVTHFGFERRRLSEVFRQAVEGTRP
ncbi:MAG: ATP-binding cassette domain-containing protein [Actinomycetota bacterium]|nr:ATP-binding cassette domain-containing protein [Actinomycetota bacterium]MDQ3574755.1 ATP-binding cassette domain-containing protein [Actinomycetota bacterium]